MATNVTYGIGGFDPELPDNNAIESVEVEDAPISPLESAIAKLTELGLSLDEAQAVAGV